MLYTWVELNKAALSPLHTAAKAGRAALRSPFNPIAQTDYGRSLAATLDVLEQATRMYGKPGWQIDKVRIDDVSVPVVAETVWQSPWARLIHFRKDEKAVSRARSKGARPLPRLLIAAPLSGHYATLLSGTVEAFLPHHDVYITDWQDARMVPLWQGRFDLDDYIDHIRDMLGHLGPGAHVLSVCQPGPPVLAAIAMMAEDKDPALPASMTFMGSPIDARKSPTVPNRLAETKPYEWFQDNMVYTVPAPYPGMLRRVYPGFVQLSSFMNMNWESHVDAHWEFFNHLVEGDGEDADRHRAFYDEYLSVLDMTEEFYLQTIKAVFQEHHLARGIYNYRGQRIVDPSAIETVALMTVEGELDDISGIGQTQAAHDICTHIPETMRRDYVQPGVGHYGVFNGARFRAEICPRVAGFIARFENESMTD